MMHGLPVTLQLATDVFTRLYERSKLGESLVWLAAPAQCMVRDSVSIIIIPMELGVRQREINDL